MNFFYLFVGFIFLILGVVGIYLPIMPATPFLLVATFCFSKGSKSFNDFFVSTKFYKENIGPIRNKSGMTIKRKGKILLIITLAICISIFVVNNLHARIAMILVLIFHYLYFIFGIRTIEEWVCLIGNCLGN